MRIAVNAGSFSNSFNNLFLKLSASRPDHTFLFVFDKPLPEKPDFSENVVPIVIERKGDSSLQLKFWYHFKIPAAFKKYKADIFISKKFISLTAKTPQLLVAPDLTYANQPSFVPKRQFHFYKKNTPLFLKKADRILVSSDFLKKEIIQRYGISEGSIKVLYPEIEHDFKELTFDEKVSIKEQYTEGNEYFMYHGIIGTQQNLVNLLKAFSLFKKRQKSKMQLIIAGSRGINYEEFAESLRLFRFNKEVKVLENLPGKEVEKIFASAYALLHVPVYESESPGALAAMKYNVPAILSSRGALPEYFENAALYTEPENFREIAEKMMLLFKDEKIRRDLIEKGLVKKQKFLQKKNEDILLQIIEEVVTKNPLN